MRALIQAAGKGTRINEKETRIIPKPLHKVGDKTIIERVILSMKEAGIKEFIIVVGFMSEHIKEYLRDGSELGVSIAYLYNPDYEKGQGLSILRGKELLSNETFLLSVGDHLFEPKVLKEFIKKAGENRCILAVDKRLEEYVHSNPTKVLENNGKILKLGKEIDEFNAVDCGLHIMTPEIFECLEEARYIYGDDITSNDACKILAGRGNYFTYDIKEGKWAGINTKQDLAECKKKFPEWEYGES